MYGFGAISTTNTSFTKVYTVFYFSFEPFFFFIIYIAFFALPTCSFLAFKEYSQFTIWSTLKVIGGLISAIGAGGYTLAIISCWNSPMIGLRKKMVVFVVKRVVGI